VPRGGSRRESGVEDERARGVDQVLDHRWVGKDGPALAPRDFDSVTVSTTSGSPAMPARCAAPRPPAPTTPSEWGLVDDEQRSVPTADRVQVLQGRQVAVDREHRIGHDERRHVRHRRENRVHGRHVVVPHDMRRRPRQPARVDDRGMVERVRDDHAARRRQRGDHGQVAR
jgi:hypothetical protein